MSLGITCYVLDDLEKLGQGQLDLESFFNLTYLCNCLRYRLVVEKMSLCITHHILDDLEILGQGQIELQNVQFAIS